MSLTHDIQARLESVEFKMMEMEQTIAELNEVILRHYQDIERLSATNAALQKQLDEVGSGGKAPSDIDQLPPHY
ncbi:MAG: SlyX family protein [Gammaproteobacteria bacterium]|nr:SlyX family protein [Gammaproteobacteria bacterium]